MIALLYKGVNFLLRQWSPCTWGFGALGKAEIVLVFSARDMGLCDEVVSKRG